MLYLIVALTLLGLTMGPLTDRHSCKGHCDPFTSEPGIATPADTTSGGGVSIPPDTAPPSAL